MMQDVDIAGHFAKLGFPNGFGCYADLLSWDSGWNEVLDADAAGWRWFADGQLNASYNCVDRHLVADRNKAAFIWIPEPESDGPRAMTYQVLYRKVNEFAGLLRETGVRAGSTVVLHLPMVPELPVSMLACARLGAVHCVVDPDTGPVDCARRIVDSGSRVVVTMDALYRDGELVDHKIATDEAVWSAVGEGAAIERVLVWRRWPRAYSSKAPMVAGRDVFGNDAVKHFRGHRVVPAPVPADAALFLLYPDGGDDGYLYHTGGFLAYAAGVCRYHLDLRVPDTHWSAAGISSLLGHTALVYGPLALGTTSVLYEGRLTYPDPGRPWRISERHGVTSLVISTDAVAELSRVGADEPARHDLSLRRIGMMGREPEAAVWSWCGDVVGRGSAAVTWTWWHQIGGMLASTHAGDAESPESGRASGLLSLALGLDGELQDANGDVVLPDRAGVGELVVRNRWPGLPDAVRSRDPGSPLRPGGGFATGRKARYDGDRRFRLVDDGTSEG